MQHSLPHLLLLLLLLAHVPSVAAKDCPLPEGVRRDEVVPVVRSQAGLRQLNAQRTAHFPKRDLNEELAVVYVRNSAQSLTYFSVAPEDAECWSLQDTLVQQLRNVIAETSQVKVLPTRKPGVLMAAAGGNFEPSFILSLRVLQSLTGLSSEHFFVAVPNTDMLLILNPKGPYSASGLHELANELYSSGSRRLSKHVFRVSACAIEVVRPDSSALATPCN